MKKLVSILILVCSNSVLSAQSNNCRALLSAVKNGNSVAVENLLSKTSPNCYYREDGEPRYPLGAAAYTGDLKMGKLLMDSGAKVSFRGKRDASALMIAAKNAHLEFATSVSYTHLTLPTKA